MAVAPKKTTKPKAVAKPKPKSAGLKKDGTAIPNQLERMRTTGKYKQTANVPVGTKNRFKKMAAMKAEQGKIGKRMGIGDAEDVDYYVSGVDKNTAKAKAAIIKKRATANNKVSSSIEKKRLTKKNTKK
jgi:hypothetical protein